MTLREVVQFLEAATWRQEQVERTSIITAWYSALLANHAANGKLGKLSEYLPGDDDGESPAQELSPEQEALTWELLALMGSVGTAPVIGNA